MQLFSFSTGLTLRRGKQLLEFRRQLQDNQVQFEETISGKLHTWNIATVYREINDGTLFIFRSESDAQNVEGISTPKLPLVTSIESLPEKFRDDVARKMDYINSCKKAGLSRGHRIKIAAHIKKISIRREEKTPSTSTVMSWWRAFENFHCCPNTLISGNAHRKRSRKLNEETISLIRETLKKEYFTRKRYPLTRAHILINRAAASLAGAKESPKQEISLSTVRRIANEVDPYFRDVARFGPAYAKNQWRYSLSGVTTKRVMERIEIDHTQIDMVVICDRSGMPLGRPTITVAIDAHSGYVIAFFVSFWGASLSAVLNTIKIAIQPKDRFCNGAVTLNKPWLGYGLFELIVVDNGLEFQSPQFQLAAWHLNADIQYCAVREPWLKPSIERCLGVQGLYLPGEGKIHKPKNNYLPPNPKKTASITFSQLCSGLLKCFVDILPMEPDRRTLIEPFEVFKEGFERLPPPLLPGTFNDLDLISALTRTLTVSGHGVEFFYLRFNSIQLQNIVRKTAKRFTTLVKYHPENLNYIYVQDPQNKDWLYVPSCYPEYTSGLSLVQHRAIREHLKLQLNKRNTLEILLKGKLELIDLYDGFLRGNKGKKNVAMAQAFGTLTSAQTLDSTVSKPPVCSAAPNLVTEQDMHPSEEEIPAFENFLFIDNKITTQSHFSTFTPD